MVYIPVILFPNAARAISNNADYVFFMELLNSLEYKYRGGEQLEGALLIKKWDIIPISMGYIVISTSKTPTTLETRTQLDTIHQEDVDKAVKYAVYAEMRGMSCVYLEAGSNAEYPVSTHMVHSVSSAIDIPVIVGGGIKTADMAQEKIDAGARVIVNGTATEKNIKLIKEIILRILPG
jgi:phosphoglycerol geranylgeranyltransferase